MRSAKSSESSPGTRYRVIAIMRQSWQARDGARPGPADGARFGYLGARECTRRPDGNAGGGAAPGDRAVERGAGGVPPPDAAVDAAHRRVRAPGDRHDRRRLGRGGGAARAGGVPGVVRLPELARARRLGEAAPHRRTGGPRGLRGGPRPRTVLTVLNGSTVSTAPIPVFRQIRRTRQPFSFFAYTGGGPGSRRAGRRPVHGFRGTTPLATAPGVLSAVRPAAAGPGAGTRVDAEA